MVRKLNISIEQVLKRKITSSPTGHNGDSIGFRNMCAFLFRKHASFIIFQNSVIDRGTINATK